MLAKSDTFRNLYWTSLYVVKAVEYIHRRLLGRPTYGRQEINSYFDICAKKGFYALVDEIIDSLRIFRSFWRRYSSLRTLSYCGWFAAT